MKLVEEVVAVLDSIGQDEDIFTDGYHFGYEVGGSQLADAEIKGHRQRQNHDGIRHHWEHGIEVHVFRHQRKIDRQDADELMVTTINDQIVAAVDARKQAVANPKGQLLEVAAEGVAEADFSTNELKVVDQVVGAGALAVDDLPMITRDDIQAATMSASAAAKALLRQRDRDYRVAKAQRKQTVEADIAAMLDVIPPLESDAGVRHVHLEVMVEQHVDEIDGIPMTNHDGTPGLWPIRNQVWRWVTWDEAGDYNILLPIVTDMVDEARSMIESRMNRTLVHGRTLDDQLSAFRAKQ